VQQPPNIDISIEPSAPVSAPSSEGAGLDEALRRAHRRNAAFLDALPDLIFLLDRNGVFLDYHAPQGAELAAPPEVFIGRRIDEVLPPDVAMRALEDIRLAHETGEAQIFEYTLKAFPGIHYESRIVASGDDEVLAIIRDVTARHQVEAAFRNQFDKLRELDRMKSDFVSAVSHELRTPLTSIVGYAEFLEDDPEGRLSSEQVEFVEQVQANAKRLRRLVDDLLEFGLMDSASFRLACREEDLAAKLRLVIQSLKPQLDRKGVTLGLDLPEGPILLVADGDRLEQVLTNLLHNAIKFTPEHGQIQVAVAAEPLSVGVAVTDTGIGIPSELQGRIFEKFFQVEHGLRRLHGGAGLGLAISKALVEAHGGAIGVTSAEGEGSTFWFTLPRQCIGEGRESGCA
jgi:signal transduction histidine kinase